MHHHNALINAAGADVNPPSAFSLRPSLIFPCAPLRSLPPCLPASLPPCFPSSCPFSLACFLRVYLSTEPTFRTLCRLVHQTPPSCTGLNTGRSLRGHSFPPPPLLFSFSQTISLLFEIARSTFSYFQISCDTRARRRTRGQDASYEDTEDCMHMGFWVNLQKALLVLRAAAPLLSSNSKSAAAPAQALAETAIKLKAG